MGLNGSLNEKLHTHWSHCSADYKIYPILPQICCPKCALFCQHNPHCSKSPILLKILAGRIRKALVGAADGVQQIAVTLQDKVRSGKVNWPIQADHADCPCIQTLVATFVVVLKFTLPLYTFSLQGHCNLMLWPR